MKLSPALRFLGAALILSSAGCQKKPEAASTTPKPAAPPKLVSAEPTSFEAVTRHLDPGGRAYLYFSTEAFLHNAGAKLSQIVPQAIAAGKLEDAKREQAQKMWQTLATIASKVGLREISGFGASSIALEPGYFQNKWMIHHNPDKANGLIWKMFGGNGNALELIPYLPERTALASSGNLRLAPVWDAVQRETAANESQRQGLEQFTQQFEKGTGLNFAALLGSLGPNYAMVVTFDESRPTSLPIAGPNAPAVTIPEPGIALFVQVQDDMLVNRIDQELSKNPMVTKAAEGDWQLRTFALPLPMAYVRPTIAWKKGQLLLASSDLLVHEMLDVKGGKKTGLSANPQFQKLRGGLPAEGCGFAYISPLYSKVIFDINAANLNNPANTMDPALKQLLQTVYAIAPRQAACGVTQETPEGWISVSHVQTVAPTTPAK